MTDQSAIVHDPAKRARLINSAAALFSRVGFERATVDDIADGADVAKGTVYLYFRNKADLFRAILLELRGQLEDRAREHEEEPDAVLRRLVRRYLMVAQAAPDLFRCFTSALFGVNREFQAAATEIFDAQRSHVASVLCRIAGTRSVTRSMERRASLFVGAILAAALVGGLEGARSREMELEEDALMALIREPLR
jgi:AcrR family transcriptional regulator